MNKKFGVLFLSLFLILSIIFVTAIENPLEDKLDDLEEVGEFIDDEDVRSEYLTQEWTKLLEKTQAGKIILGIGNFLSKISPIFKVILGVEYSLSWAFVFAIIIWLIFFIFILGPADAFFPNKLFSIIGAFIITSLIGISGSIKKILDILIINLVDNQRAIWISIIIAIILIVLFRFLGKAIGDWFKKTKEEAKKEKTKEAEETIRTKGEIYQKGMRRGGEGKRRGQFVSKRAVERYNRRFGDKVSKERFDKKK
tara:strand:- start:808 stop:1569 length:762 start_codon:yes stop_codon:yes gene_type:complete